MSVAMLLLVAVSFGCKKQEAQQASEPEQEQSQEAAPAAAPDEAAPAQEGEQAGQ